MFGFLYMEDYKKLFAYLQFDFKRFNFRKYYSSHLRKNWFTSIYKASFEPIRFVQIESCTHESSFSKLKPIKKYLQSTISQESIVKLFSLSIENDIPKPSDFEMTL